MTDKKRRDLISNWLVIEDTKDIINGLKSGEAKISIDFKGKVMVMNDGAYVDLIVKQLESELSKFKEENEYWTGEGDPIKNYFKK